MTEEQQAVVEQFDVITDEIVKVYVLMRKLSSTRFSSERRQLKDMLGDLKIAQTMVALDER